MLFEEAYERYLILNEENGSTDSIATDRFRFKTIYNICQNKIVEWFIENKNSDETRYLQEIKVPFKTLDLSYSKKKFISFSLPKDYFEFINVNIEADKGGCQSQMMKNFEIKPENYINYYTDPFLDPNFEYRETFYTFFQNEIHIYRKDFEISNVELSYYKYPIQIELENEDNPESPFKNKKLSFDDKLINRIIFMTSSIYSLSTNDPKYQAFKQETIQKF